MRRIWGIIALVLVIANLACHGRERRRMRPADVQIYDLPPADAAWTTQPPDYPKTDRLVQTKDKGITPPSANLRGAGGGPGAGGAGGPAGPGGPGGY